MTPWRLARAAAADAATQPQVWPIALAGFLARGGIVLFLGPVVTLPSVVGLATFIGPATITPTGPTLGLVIRIVLGTTLLVGALLAGLVVGAAAEIALVEAVRDRSDPGSGPSRPPGLLRRVFVVRLISLLPVVALVGAAIQGLGEIVYDELTLPTNLVTPIVVRVAERAPLVVAAILLTWIVGETWGGLGVRRVVLGGAGPIQALAGGLALLLRRSPAVALLAVLGGVVAVGVLGLVLGLIGWSWDLVRDALLGGSGIGAIGAMVASTVAFVACWILGLTVAGGLAAWRSGTWTRFVGEDHRGSGRTDPERATL